MNALVLLLAGMAVGNGPEGISAETEQGLDLRGEWEGTYQDKAKRALHAHLSDAKLRLWNENISVEIQFPIVDEGGGKFRYNRAARTMLGIYKQERDCVTFCFRLAFQTRPASFSPGNGQCLLILHRVKPGK
jgi:hypothetical protein